MRTIPERFRGSAVWRCGVAWIVLTAFAWSFLAPIQAAQSPTATISLLRGTVLVNGQAREPGARLNVGDVLETREGAIVVLELSDGSQVEVGERTTVDITELSQTAAGARVSRLKLAWGRVRAQLSPDHQQTGAAFSIETPNALVGVKFSQPDVEVSYDSATQETVALALTVALLVKNFITGEEQIIPMGSMAVITAFGIQVMTGATATGLIGAELPDTTTAAAGTTSAAPSSGVGAGTLLAVGAGVVAAGGVAAIAAHSSEREREDDEGYSLSDLRGTWNYFFLPDHWQRGSGQITFDARGHLTNLAPTGNSDVTSFYGTAAVSSSGAVEVTILVETFEPDSPCSPTKHTLTMRGVFITTTNIEGTFTQSSVSEICGLSATDNGRFALTR